VFYWSHMLFVPFWIILILHAPNFWKWFIVPAIIFIVEKVIINHLITFNELQ